MRKPRADALLLNLPEGQQAQLAEVMISGAPYHTLPAYVEKEFGIAVRSLNVFSKFWEAVCVPHLLQRRTSAVKTADAIAEQMAEDPGQLEQATIDALSQAAFNMAIRPGADPRDVKALFSLVLKAKDQKLSDRQLTLEREKFEFDAAEKALAAFPQLSRTPGVAGLSANDQIQAIRARMFANPPEVKP